MEWMLNCVIIIFSQSLVSIMIGPLKRVVSKSQRGYNEQAGIFSVRYWKSSVNVGICVYCYISIIIVKY